MAIGVGLALLLQAASPVSEHIFPMPRLAPCRLSASTMVTHLRELPDEVRLTLQTFLQEGGIAEADGPFNATDTWLGHPPYPWRRFLRAYRHGIRWVIWYEVGGRGYHLNAIGVIQRKWQTRPEIDEYARYSGFNGQQLCAASRAYFDGAQLAKNIEIGRKRRDDSGSAFHP
jgi:hypothetical protein